MIPPIRRSLVVVLAGAAVLATGSCSSSDDSADDAPTTVTEADASVGSAPTSSTVDRGANAPAVSDDLCTVLDEADVAAAGALSSTEPVAPADAARVALGTEGAEASCQWTFAGTKVLVATATGVDSAAFEEVLAQPGVDDPRTVDGLGEMAAEGSQAGSDGGTTSYLVAYEAGRVVKLDSSLPADQLQGLARLVLAALA